MSLPKFEYQEARTLKGACRMLQEHHGRARLIAGGTDLLQQLKYRLKEPELLVDVSAVQHLGQMSYSARQGLKIGALVSLRQLASDPIVQTQYPMLAQAACQVGTAQLQAMGTVGGNLCQDNLCLYYNRSRMLRLPLAPCLKLGGDVCHAVANSRDCWAVYSGDLAPVLLALNATVVIVDPKGKTELPLSKLYSGDGKRPQKLKPGQILTDIRVPAPVPQSAGVYLKMRQRKAIDYPLLGVAFYLVLKEDKCAEARLALTGIAQAPLPVPEAVGLKGKAIGEADVQALAQAAFRRARPLSNVSPVTPKYRREMVKVYVRQAVGQTLDIIHGRGAR